MVLEIRDTVEIVLQLGYTMIRVCFSEQDITKQFEKHYDSYMNSISIGKDIFMGSILRSSINSNTGNNDHKCE